MTDGSHYASPVDRVAHILLLIPAKQPFLPLGNSQGNILY